MSVKTISYNQHDILADILALHCDTDTFNCDLTYGNGVFYKYLPKPYIRLDIDRTLEGLTDIRPSTETGIATGILSSCIFDPPFLTHIKQGRAGNGNMAMAKRFGGYWKYSDLEAHYSATAKEAARILATGGVFVVKCQDIIYNCKHHPTHINMHGWAVQEGFRLLDLFILTAKYRMPIPTPTYQQGPRVQRHARIYHSYFMVFKRLAQK